MGGLRPRTWRLWVLAGIAVAAAAAGCRSSLRPVPFQPPHYQPLAPADDPTACYSLTPDGTALRVDCSALRPPREMLALSSGGAYGAFTAGVLSGWTATGQRPEFDVVTGVSTGALIAPFAFLGPEYDCRANRLYVGVKAEDVYQFRTWVTIPFRDAFATSLPLRKLIESQVTPDLMAKLAAEHLKGRRLYVGTTNLDTRRFVVWDLGAIACRPCPDSCQLVRDILLASASVPGMLPPVSIEVEVDGKKYRELHCDGGATATVFMPSSVFAAVSRNPVGEADGARNFYVIVAGKLFPDAAPVRRRVLPVLGASADALLYANTRAELANLYALARRAGMSYRQAALNQDFPATEGALSFDKREQTRLLAEGMRVGSGGPLWQDAPPALMAGDADVIRSGVQLRKSANPCPPTAP